MALLPILSALCGWIYTFSWSASFYPQLLLNARRKSFLAYFLSSLALYASPLIRAQYASRHENLTPTVQSNDIAFALHALLASALTVSQYLCRSWWGIRYSVGAKPSRFIMGVAGGSFVGVAVVWLLTVRDAAAAAAAATGTAGVLGVRDGGSGVATGVRVNPATSWCELDIVYALGHVKLIISLIKLWPQILANYRNKSTRGWSVWQVVLDLVGGVLSTTQQGIDSYLQGHWSGITGNPIKFALGNISFVYDGIFLAQHYVLYRGEGGDEDREALLRRDGDEEEEEDRGRGLSGRDDGSRYS
ncbi:hypothetical protein E4U32_006322 [Claviceps aff. humidiphila group G2b]|nr:hypothetical protein E4U32_006322 [Claviceps aff. humidiphila group G2b]